MALDLLPVVSASGGACCTPLTRDGDHASRRPPTCPQVLKALADPARLRLLSLDRVARRRARPASAT